MNGRFTPSSQLIFKPGTKILGHSLQNFNTHDHFGNLIYLSGKSHILENSASLARGWIGSHSGNKKSLYLETIFLH